MNCIWYLVNKEKRRAVAIGQGYGSMKTLWTEEKDSMAWLRFLLNHSRGERLVFMNEHELEEFRHEDGFIVKP